MPMLALWTLFFACRPAASIPTGSNDDPDTDEDTDLPDDPDGFDFVRDCADGRVWFQPPNGAAIDWTDRFGQAQVDINRAGTLHLCGGAYGVALVFGAEASPFVIEGHGSTLNGDADGPGGRGVVDYAVVGDLTVRDVTITAGSADFGGGLFAAGQVALEHVDFVGNHAVGADDTGWGGGAFITQGVLTLDDVTFVGNIADANGGGLGTDGATTLAGTATITDNFAVRGGGLLVLEGSGGLQGATFTGNRADSGGQIFVSGGALVLNGTTITHGGGGTDIGAGIVAVGAALTLDDTTVEDHFATSGGAGIYAIDGSVVTLNDATLRDNESIRFVGLQPSNFGGEGGAVYLSASDLVCTDSDLGGNGARWGAAVYAAFSSSGTASITSTRCDWDSTPLLGAGTSAQIHVVVDGFGSEIRYDPGTNASFTCTAAACTD